MKNIDDSLTTLNTDQTLPFYGNKPCIDMILKLISNESISQSLIFSGPSGLGKFTLSYKLALHILHDGCETLKKTKDINTIVNKDILKLISSSTFPDLLIISSDNKNIISVDEVREIRNFFSKKPIYSNFKICIVNSIDKMNFYGLNAMLKSLEDLSHNSIIILIANNDHHIIPTIKSRCRVIKFFPLDLDSFSLVLRSKKIDIDHNNTINLYKMSNGSPGIAISIHETVGMNFYDEIKSFFQHKNYDILKLHKFSENLTKRNENIEKFEYFEFFIIKILLENIKESLSLKDTKPLKKYIDVYDNVVSIFKDTKKYNLDNKRATFSILSHINQT